MAQQIRLFEFRMGERNPETHVVSVSNQAAAQMLTGWRSWPGGAMALTGPQGSGKSHLATVWARESEALWVDPRAKPAEAAELFEQSGGRLIVDDAQGAPDEMMLIRLLDLARWRKGAVLLVGENDPAHWPCATPDLVSRLFAVPAARLEEPDEALLEVVLKRACRELFIELSDKSATYLATHMERTFAQAHAIAAELDRSVVQGARPISIPQAKKALAAVQARAEIAP